MKYGLDIFYIIFFYVILVLLNIVNFFFLKKSANKDKGNNNKTFGGMFVFVNICCTFSTGFHLVFCSKTNHSFLFFKIIYKIINAYLHTIILKIIFKFKII